MATTRIADLIALGSSLSKISIEDIKSKKRNRPIFLVRAAIARLAVDYGHSQSKVGAVLGGRDHTTIGSALDSWLDHYRTDKEYRRFFADLKKAAEEAESFLVEGQYDFAMFGVRKPKQLRPMFDHDVPVTDGGRLFHNGVSKASNALLTALRAA